MGSDSDRRVAFLVAHGAAETSHSQRNLLEHLQGTCRLLTRWGNPPAVCSAGLFHSVYGTYVFDRGLLPLDARDAVRAVIGAEAERLAWLFAVSDRRGFFEADAAGGATLRVAGGDESLAVDPTTRSRLIEIEAANTVEQLPRRKKRRAPEYDWYRQAFERSVAQLSPGAVEGFREAFAAAREAWCLPAEARRE